MLGYTEMIMKTTSLVSERTFYCNAPCGGRFHFESAARSPPPRRRLDVDSTRDATGCHLAWLDFGAEPIKRRARRRPGGGATSRFGHVPGIWTLTTALLQGQMGRVFADMAVLGAVGFIHV